MLLIQSLKGLKFRTLRIEEQKKEPPLILEDGIAQVEKLSHRIEEN